MTFWTPTLYVEGVAEAASTLRRNPLRASLAALAMAVAVATTAIVQTALDGLAETARQTSERAFGSNSFALTRVASGSLSRRELATKLERNPNIKRQDLRFLEGVADGVVAYAAIAQRQADVSAGGRKFENAAISGTQATLPDLRDISLARGRFLSVQEEASGAQVVVIGRDIATALFPARDALGQSVRIGRRGFQIVGIQAPQGTAGGQSLDRNVYMPLIAFERTFGAPPSLQIFATGGTGIATETAEDRALISMRARRHLGPGAENNFDIIRPEAARSFTERLTQQVSGAGPPISLMALLAAIVVVANTTLVSVTQRTREIGVRRAIGASRRSVIVETLAESTLVALIGGGAGLVAAVGVLAVAGAALQVEFRLESTVVAASLSAAGLSGLFAGWYPASRAASTDVVNALRLE